MVLVLFGMLIYCCYQCCCAKKQDNKVQVLNDGASGNTQSESQFLKRANERKLEGVKHKGNRSDVDKIVNDLYGQDLSGHETSAKGG